MRDLSTLQFERPPRSFKPMPGIIASYDGVFKVASPTDGKAMIVICSASHGWDHISVSRQHRLPNWIEMDYIKRKFFHDHEVVMQLHVPPKDHINFEEVLHLWRPHSVSIPLPPKELV